MPIWSEILIELRATTAENPDAPPDFDTVRRKYLSALHNHTGRDVILYASGWLQKTMGSSEVMSINDEDIQALMEVTAGSEHNHLDMILHSPGGSPESAEAIVSYLRSRYTHVRVHRPATCDVGCNHDRLLSGRDRNGKALVLGSDGSAASLTNAIWDSVSSSAGHLGSV